MLFVFLKSSIQIFYLSNWQKSEFEDSVEKQECLYIAGEIQNRTTAEGKCDNI